MKKYLLFSIFFLHCNVILADTIVLKSGEKITGKITENNNYYVRIQSFGELKTYYRYNITSVELEETKPTLPPAPASKKPETQKNPVMQKEPQPAQTKKQTEKKPLAKAEKIPPRKPPTIITSKIVENKPLTGPEQKVQEQFIACKPGTKIETAAITNTLTPGTEYIYEIIAPEAEGCKIKFFFTKNPNPDYIGKEMVCVLDTTVPFKNAVAEPKSCTGKLYEMMLSTKSQKK